MDSGSLATRQSLGERVQAGLLKSLLIKILLLRQCVRVSGSGATHTLTLSLVRERVSIRSSPAIPRLHFLRCAQSFDTLTNVGGGQKGSVQIVGGRKGLLRGAKCITGI
jgi:hypothetical protein